MYGEASRQRLQRHDTKPKANNRAQCSKHRAQGEARPHAATQPKHLQQGLGDLGWLKVGGTRTVLDAASTPVVMSK
jgi:hypothetical protein